MARPKRREIPILEWIAGSISLAIVLGTIGFLVVDALRTRSDAPRLTARVTAIRQDLASFVVEVVVENASRTAAADVHVSGTARSPDDRTVVSTARIEHVPGLATRRASLVFGFDPRSTLEARVIGYSVP